MKNAGRLEKPTFVSDALKHVMQWSNLFSQTWFMPEWKKMFQISPFISTYNGFCHFQCIIALNKIGNKLHGQRREL